MNRGSSTHPRLFLVVCHIIFLVLCLPCMFAARRSVCGGDFRDVLDRTRGGGVDIVQLLGLLGQIMQGSVLLVPVEDLVQNAALVRYGRLQLHH